MTSTDTTTDDTATTSAIGYTRDDDGVVTLLLDAPGRSANTMDALFRTSLAEVTARLVAEREHVTGVIWTSAKKTFFAGGDLNELIRVTPENVTAFAVGGDALKADLRTIETLGVPVVAALAGTALGGGWEIALAAHHRVAVDDPAIKLGLPEVTLGLLPGGGGVVRTVRLLGLATALPLLTEGTQLRPAQARAAGLLHELVADRHDLVPAARAWIAAHPQSVQPFDAPGWTLPGGSVADAGMMLAAVPAMLHKKTRGTMPAPEAILAAAVESTRVDTDTALRIETAYLAELAAGPVAKNMIGTFFFGLNAINAGGSRPAAVPVRTPQRLGVVGAGMMGAGIAHVAAVRGIEVVLIDHTAEAAERGKAHGADILTARVDKGAMTAAAREEVLARITTAVGTESVAGCDLVIEAVFEDRDVKREVHAAAAAAAPDAVIASNTSTLPITGLATAVPRPETFVGLHFFSPVHKMPLVEIIRGEQTDEATLAFAFDTVRALGKTPIVVNDSRGFFTSRVFGTFTSEGIAMLAEGVLPARIENLARAAGMPVGPLAVSDEVSLTLMAAVRRQAAADAAAEGTEAVLGAEHPANEVITRMVEELGRPGKAAGAGFYDYADGTRRLWPELTSTFAPAELGGAELGGAEDTGTSDTGISDADITDRFLFVEALESVRCLQEGVLTSVADANIGSIMGIGYPPWTGGVLQFLNYYGLPAAVSRATELAARYGERFTPPALLVEKAAAGETL